MRKLVATAALVIAATVTLPHSARAEGGPGNPRDVEAEFVADINALRAEQGLHPLEVHSELVAKARSWSQTMADKGDIWHSNLPDGITVNWHRLGENVGMGGSEDALHQAFIDSPGHYKNLVDPGFRFVGLGVTVDAEGTIFVAEEFMELASQPAPAAPSPAAGTPSSQPVPPPTPAAPVASTPSPEETPRSMPVAEASDRPEPSARISSVLDRLRGYDE